MTAELNESNDQLAKATELKQLAEEEAARSELIVQAVKIDKQILPQEVQNLTDIVEYFRKTIVKSIDKFISRPKLELSLFVDRYRIKWRILPDITRYPFNKIRSSVS